MKKTIITAALAMVMAGAPLTASISVSHADDRLAKARKQLDRILGRHLYRGFPITPDMREAAGDRRMAVFDHRFERFAPATCSFITYRGKRAITCTS